MKRVFIFFISILIFSNSQASNTDTLWQKANQLYTENNFRESAKYYEQILATGMESPDIYFNLGNAYFKQNILASSILNYERALRFDAENADILHNLDMARLMLLDKIEPLPTFRFSKWYNSFVQIFSANLWGILSLILFGGCLVLFLIYFFSKSYGMRKLSFFIAVVALSFSVCSHIFGQKHRGIISNNTDAIIFSPVVTVKGSPDNNSTDLFIIHEGLKVKIIDEIGEWNRIVLADGNQGWAPAESMQRVYN